MRSNYRRIGDFIELVDERNRDLKIDLLLGLSISKEFIASVANTVGADMANYKIIRKGQFACSIMQVRRDKKIPVALLKDYDEAIISQAYPVFKIIDESELLPEYLMMWMSRPEFDRHACFLAVGGVRGSLEWEDFLDMKLPVPSIEKQREIVKEYNTIVNRIKLNEQLNQKLEETAQALYKHWFADFNFPITKESCPELVSGSPHLEGKPYKSSGGKMVYNEELDKEIPEGWDYLSVQALIDKEIIFKNQDGNHGEIHPKSTDFMVSGVPFIMAKDLEFGTLELSHCKFISIEQSEKLRIDPAITGDVLLTHKATMGRVAIVPHCVDHVVLTPQVTYYRVKDKSRINKEFLYTLFMSQEFQRTLISDSEQSTRNFLSITNQRLLKVLLPDATSIEKFKSIVEPILNRKALLYSDKKLSIKMIGLLESKMTKVEGDVLRQVV